MQKGGNHAQSGSSGQGSATEKSAGNTQNSSFADRVNRQQDHTTPEPHSFRPVLLTGFGGSAVVDQNGTVTEFCSEDAAYPSLSNSFRSWEQARRAQPATAAVFSSTFDTKVFPHEFFRSTAESLYAQLDPAAFGLSRGAGNTGAAGSNVAGNGATGNAVSAGNTSLQACISPASFESPFDSLVGAHTMASNAFCPLGSTDQYNAFGATAQHGAAPSSHFISSTSMLNLPSTSQMPYGAAYSSVFGGFGNQQGMRGTATGWPSAAGSGNGSVLDMGGNSNQNGDSSAHDHNMNATSYEMLCGAAGNTGQNGDGGVARSSMMDHLGAHLHGSLGLPVATAADGSGYLVSIVPNDPSGVNSALGGVDGCKVIAQLTGGAQSLGELDYDPRDLEQFAEKFKQRRIKLGITQSDVGKMLGQLKIPGVGPLSQSTICRFESLTLSHNNMIALKPVLQSWLDYAEMQAIEKFKNANDSLNGCSQNGQNDRKRKRTSITDSEKRALEAYFAVQPRPSSEKIAQIADKLNLKKNVVRVWFCNQRQKQKRMKFANQGAGNCDTAANSPPAAADDSQKS